MNLEPHYPLSQCAEYLECSEAWLRSKLRDRTFAGIKVAGRWRMRESQMEAALDAMSTQAREPVAPSPSGLSRNSRFRRRMNRAAS